MADPTPPPGFEPVAAAAAEPAPPSGFVPVKAPGVAESFLRGMPEGAAFGFDDKLGMDKERRELSRQTNPWSHFMGELVGGAGPMLAAAVLPTGVGQAAAAGRGAQMLGRGINLVRGALAPGEINTLGQGAKQGAKLGAVYGGLSGAGHADVKDSDALPEALGKRAVGALTGAGEGAVIGPILGAAGHGVYRGGQFIGGLKALADEETAGLGQGALKTATRKLEEDRITPQQVMSNIRSEFPSDTATAGGPGTRFWGPGNVPAPQRGVWTADMVEDIVRGAAAGDSAADISAALTQKLGGKGPGPDAVQTMLGELADRHLGPLNLVDRTGMVRRGSGDNTQMTMRAAAATPGEHVGIARENLLERQVGAQGRLGQLLDRTIGSSDYEGVAAKHAGELQSAGNRAYGLAYANEQPFNLTPTWANWIARYQGKAGPIPEGVMSEINGMTLTRRAADGSTFKTPPQTLEEFIMARQGLFDTLQGLKDKPNLKRELTKFYNEISDEVGKTNPSWVEANRIWRDGKVAQDAMEAGTRMTTRLNAGSRENLAEFTSARQDGAKATKELREANKPVNAALKKDPNYQPSAAEQAAIDAAQAKLDAANSRQELFKVGLVRSLSDMLANQGETHNLTKQLLLPGAQKMLRQVLGKDADQFFKALRAEQAMHRTYQSQFGSQTTPLREAVDELSWAPRFEASMLNPLTWANPALRLAQEYAARTINAKRNTDLMKLYTETDPLKQLEALRAMQTLHTARSNMGNKIGKPVVGLGSGVYPETLVADEAAPPTRPRRP